MKKAYLYKNRLMLNLLIIFILSSCNQTKLIYSDYNKHALNELQGAIAMLWRKSSPDQPLKMRLEQGGFIIKKSNGDLILVEFSSNWQRFPCGIHPSVRGLQIRMPANTVGLIHTHPYAPGTNVGPLCGKEKPFIYHGLPSYNDLYFQQVLSLRALHKGYITRLNDFVGIVIDAGGIRITRGTLIFENTVTLSYLGKHTQAKSFLTLKQE